MGISSMTKPITAAAAMLLVEECKLRLDEPVDALLPEIANRRVLKSVAADALALGQGPPNPMALPPPDEWMRRLGTLPLIFQPGEQWIYNSGSDVLGVLIARASGSSLRNFLAERVCEPLGMKDTAFAVPKEKQHRFTTTYSTDPSSGALSPFDGPTSGQWSALPPFPSGAGGLDSTVDEMLAFGEMMLGTCARGGHANPRASHGRADDERSSHRVAEAALGQSR